MVERLSAALDAATRDRLQDSDPATVDAWASRLVNHLAAAADQSADVDGLAHALRTRAQLDQLYGDGSEAPALVALADAVAAWRVEIEADRILAAAEADLDGGPS